SGRGELVDVRRLNVRAVEPDVLPPQVVRQDVDNVGAWSALRGSGAWHDQQATDDHGEHESTGRPSQGHTTSLLVVNHDNDEHDGGICSGHVFMSDRT